MANGSSTADSRNTAILAELLETACSELIASYGISATVQRLELPAAAPSPSLVAAVDFGSRDLFGTVSLRASHRLVEETARRAPGMGVDPSAFSSDWTCELANQLVGRMKSKLREYELSFRISPPRLLSSEDSASEHEIHHRFICDCGSFTGYLDVLLRPGVRLERKSLPAGTPHEGDLVIL